MKSRKPEETKLDIRRQEARASHLAVGALLLVSLIYAATIL